MNTDMIVVATTRNSMIVKITIVIVMIVVLIMIVMLVYMLVLGTGIGHHYRWHDRFRVAVSWPWGMIVNMIVIRPA